MEEQEVGFESKAQVEPLSRRLKVGVITRPGLEHEVMVAHGFAEREVRGAVHGHGQHTRFIGEDAGRAVTLVHVEIEHSHAVNSKGGDGMDGAHGEVVEHAIT